MVSWSSKKQNSVSLSSSEAEYIAAGSACTQLLWMKQILKDYEIEQGKMTLYCDNLSAINISKNPVQHSRTKHIDIRHHFIRDLVEQSIVTLEHMPTKNQLVDLFTKPLDKERFKTLRMSIGMICVDWCLCVIVSGLMSKTLIEYHYLWELLTWEVVILNKYLLLFLDHALELEKNLIFEKCTNASLICFSFEYMCLNMCR